MMVSPKEIIEALRHVGCSSGLDVRHALANRIESEGIAPPDGYVLVLATDREKLVEKANVWRGVAAKNGQELRRLKSMLAAAPKGVSHG